MQIFARCEQFFGLGFYGGRIPGTIYLHFCVVPYRPYGESALENYS